MGSKEENRTIKRTIRVPVRLYEKLEASSEVSGKTINQVILDVLGVAYKVDVGDRRKGRRWY